MKGKGFILVLLMVLMAIAFSILTVSAQDVDVENMDNEQLTALLLQILEILQQEEDPAVEAVSPETSAKAVGDSETIEEVIQITIYDNKKLTVEALPAYMFIQPTKEPKPESEEDEPSGNKQPKPDNTPEPKKTPEHYENEPGIDDIDGGPCHWTFWDGQWLCMKG